MGHEWTDAQGLGPPQGYAGGTYEAQVGQPIYFNGSSSLDPAGALLTFTWDFGDGSSGSGPTPNHVRTGYRDQPLDAGTHEMILEARSDHGSALASGIYFLRLLGPDGPVTKRVAVSK